MNIQPKYLSPDVLYEGGTKKVLNKKTLLRREERGGTADKINLGRRKIQTLRRRRRKNKDKVKQEMLRLNSSDV